MAAFDTLLNIVESYGVVDFLLPFILVFTISYAVLGKTNMLGTNNRFNVIIALVLGLLFVIPHVTGQYPAGYDPVLIMNQSLPSISLVAVAIFSVLILLGIFGGGGFVDNELLRGLFLLISLGFVIYIFGSSLSLWDAPNDVFSWWTKETTEVMLVLTVFAIIVFFITGTGGGIRKTGDAALKGLQAIGKGIKPGGEH